MTVARRGPCWTRMFDDGRIEFVAYVGRHRQPRKAGVLATIRGWFR